MYIAINGTYENGNFTLEEPVPTVKKSKVVILFTEEITATSLQKRQPGGLKHLGGSISDDFNEPLEDLKEYM